MNGTAALAPAVAHPDHIPAKVGPLQALRELRELLASDGLAVTFQCVPTYRAALLAVADDYLEQIDHDTTAFGPDRAR